MGESPAWTSETPYAESSKWGSQGDTATNPEQLTTAKDINTHTHPPVPRKPTRGHRFTFTAVHEEANPSPLPPRVCLELSMSAAIWVGAAVMFRARRVTGQAREGWAPASPGSPGGASGRAPDLSPLQDGTVHLVYGILEQPFSSLEAINTSLLQTGLQRVQLLKPNISIPTLPSDLRTMEIRAPHVLVPNQETTYWCYITELPEGFPQHHIVMVRAAPPHRHGARRQARSRPSSALRPGPGAVRGPG